MKNKLIGYLILIGHIILGLVIFLTIQAFNLPKWLNPTLILVLIFSLNIGIVYVFKLYDELKTFWSIKKISHLIIGIGIGAIVNFIPLCVRLISGQIDSSNITFNENLSFYAALITIFSVSGEEFWFRGIYLNYCQRYLSSINLSLTVGLLFMLLHLFNPTFNLLKNGPTLFFAGALLTILYLHYKNIWLPIGLHFGNNFFEAVFKSAIKSDNPLFGKDGYLETILLGILFFTIVLQEIKSMKKNSVNVAET